MLQNLFCLHILCIDHQSAGVTIQTMNHMSRTLLARLLEIIIQHALHIQRTVTSRHRQDTGILLNHNQPAVFIDNLHIAALEPLLVALRLAHSNLHASLKLIVELGHRLTVNLDTTPLERCLNLRTTL